jgi:hypothetical protein
MSRNGMIVLVTLIAARAICDIVQSVMGVK